jgi:hypothetical protein
MRSLKSIAITMVERLNHEVILQNLTRRGFVKFGDAAFS